MTFFKKYDRIDKNFVIYIMNTDGLSKSGKNYISFKQMDNLNMNVTKNYFDIVTARHTCTDKNENEILIFDDYNKNKLKEMKSMIEKDFKNIIFEIKNQINNTQIEIFQNANKSLLKLYYNLGKIIEENSSWGNKFIDELAIELKISFPNIKGFSVRNLKNMKKYYIECQKSQIVQTASAQIPWSHNMLILDKIKDEEKRVWYMNQTIKNGWSYDVLAFQIKSDLYQRQVLGDKPNNFEKTLINPQSDLAKNIMKDPYILNLTTLKENYIETELESAMVDKIKTVLLELGNGFSFIGNQYKLTVGNEDYFIDMLFYHTKLHCYVVIELKNTKFKPEYAGKVNFYLSAVDDLIKDEQDNPSIGIILCREKDKFSVEYALKDINKPIGVSSYEISKYLPKDVLESLPTEEDINLHIDLEESGENNG